MSDKTAGPDIVAARDQQPINRFENLKTALKKAADLERSPDNDDPLQRSMQLQRAALEALQAVNLYLSGELEDSSILQPLQTLEDAISDLSAGVTSSWLHPIRGVHDGQPGYPSHYLRNMILATVIISLAPKGQKTRLREKSATKLGVEINTLKSFEKRIKHGGTNTRSQGWQYHFLTGFFGATDDDRPKLDRAHELLEWLEPVQRYPKLP